MRYGSLLLALILPVAPVAAVRADTGSAPVFESDPVRPIALSPDGTRLFVANAPDGRLEILAVTEEGLHAVGSVPVGLEPVAVAPASDAAVWVVNHLSDSVSVVDVAAGELHRHTAIGEPAGDLEQEASVTAGRVEHAHGAPTRGVEASQHVVDDCFDQVGRCVPRAEQLASCLCG